MHEKTGHDNKNLASHFRLEVALQFYSSSMVGRQFQSPSIVLVCAVGSVLKFRILTLI
jgi:hypothetical protein